MIFNNLFESFIIMKPKLFLILLVVLSYPAVGSSIKCISDRRLTIREATVMVLAAAGISIAGTIYLTETCVPSETGLLILPEVTDPKSVAKWDKRGPIRAWREGSKNVTIGPECKPSSKCLEYLETGELPTPDWEEGGYKVPACFGGIDHTHTCHSAGYLRGEGVRLCCSKYCPQSPDTGVIQNCIFFAGSNAIGSNNPCHPGMDHVKSAAGRHIFDCNDLAGGRTLKEIPSVRKSLRRAGNSTHPTGKPPKFRPASHKQYHR